MKTTKEREHDDLLELAWGLIANANGGDWDRATPTWHSAAIRWRDRYSETLPDVPDTIETAQNGQ